MSLTFEKKWLICWWRIMCTMYFCQPGKHYSLLCRSFQNMFFSSSHNVFIQSQVFDQLDGQHLLVLSYHKAYKIFVWNVGTHSKSLSSLSRFPNMKSLSFTLCIKLFKIQTHLFSGCFIAQLCCHAFTLRNVFGIFNPTSFTEFSRNFATIFGLLRSHKKVWNYVIDFLKDITWCSKNCDGRHTQWYNQSIYNCNFPF